MFDISPEKFTLICFSLIILVILFYPKTEKFHYIGMHKYHDDSYKLGLHGTKKMNYMNFSNLRFYDFFQLVNFFVL